MKAWSYIAAAPLLCLAGGCLWTTVDTAPAIAEGQVSLDNARSSAARQHAPGALDAAEEKLDHARQLAESGDEEEAVRAAREARVDAELAAAQAELSESEVALRAIEASIAALQQEISRSER